jgi:cellulose synthase/poly-beta-1,6-N-acetylglucosamine synthase-like glycosyltransferase
MNSIELPSNKNFGFFFSAIFITASVYCYVRGFILAFFFFTTLTLVTFIVTVVSPSYLTPFNKLWMELGLLIGRVISPIVLGSVFFFLISPVGIAMRLACRDELQLKLHGKDSCWKNRVPAGPEPASFKNQF